MSYISVLFLISTFLSVFQNKNIDCSRYDVVEYAKQFLTDEELKEKGKVLDCSGYAQMVFQHFHVEIPHSSAMQFEILSKAEGEPLPGDLVYFSTQNKKIGHVGIFIGDNRFIHSPGKQKYVRIDSLSHEYWSKRYVGFRTVFEPGDVN
jgi:cell wall-associated NlpC family hydrolase